MQGVLFKNSMCCWAQNFYPLTLRRSEGTTLYTLDRRTPHDRLWRWLIKALHRVFVILPKVDVNQWKIKKKKTYLFRPSKLKKKNLLTLAEFRVERRRRRRRRISPRAGEASACANEPKFDDSAEKLDPTLSNVAELRIWESSGFSNTHKRMRDKSSVSICWFSVTKGSISFLVGFKINKFEEVHSRRVK